jgi:hypothetical protein
MTIRGFQKPVLSLESTPINASKEAAGIVPMRIPAPNDILSLAKRERYYLQNLAFCIFERRSNREVQLTFLNIFLICVFKVLIEIPR